MESDLDRSEDRPLGQHYNVVNKASVEVLKYSYRPKRSRSPRVFQINSESNLSWELWLDEGLLVEPDSVDAPDEGERQPAKVEIFLAKLNLFFRGHFGTF